MLEHKKIAIIGLGYVGLPLAVEFGKARLTLGFDINASRIEELGVGKDKTLEVSEEDLAGAAHLGFSCDPDDLNDCKIFIVTVPTPIDDVNRPDLTPIIKASEMVAKSLKLGDIVIYESTVFPGCTEEVCVPILERVSGLVFNQDFFCGYSPERINPGDKINTLTKITKITSGSTPSISKEIDNLYKSIITAGTFPASSIKVAEAAKVIENTQRDLNIALTNELSVIFGRLGIDTLDVLEAAGSKWNFLPFRPGLVGGHCIGVDPYYLAQKAQEVGYHPEIILSGRRMNDSMGAYIVSEVVKLMVAKEIPVKGAKTLLLGITFKENCPDIRNTKAIDVYNELKAYHMDVDIFDPWANSEEVKHEFGVALKTSITNEKYDTIILAVAHKQFLTLNLKSLKNTNSLTYDVKGILTEDVDAKL